MSSYLTLTRIKKDAGSTNDAQMKLVEYGGTMDYVQGLHEQPLKNEINVQTCYLTGYSEHNIGWPQRSPNQETENLNEKVLMDTKLRDGSVPEPSVGM